jgi:hypothetical protein
MKLYGLMVAQNEGDIIVDTLTFLRRLNVFEKIFFFDLGSEDDTLTKALQFTDLLHEPQPLERVYTEGLRFELLSGQRRFFEDGDWLSIVDADEFYEGDPRPLIELAEREGATCVRTYQAEFMLTDTDLAAIKHEDPSLPVTERRKHYLIQWSEDRFFKFLPDAGLLNASRPGSRKLVNRHYQYRTPEQIDLRIRTRLANKIKARQLPNRQTWPQIFSQRWSDYVTPHRLLHHDDGRELKFGLPDGVQWKNYYSKNPFSTIFPQVATALAVERLTVSSQGCAPAGAQIGRAREGAIQTDRALRDDYRAHVLQDIRANLAHRRWSDAAGAALVLARHLTRWGRHWLLPFCRLRARRTVQAALGRIKAIQRRLRGRRYGLMRAQPNPIVRPQMSWQGATTLTWRSNATRVEVHVGAPDGPRLGQSAASGTITTDPFVTDATTFYLQDVSEGQALTRAHTLATATVDVLQGSYVSADA